MTLLKSALSALLLIGLASNALADRAEPLLPRRS